MKNISLALTFLLLSVSLLGSSCDKKSKNKNSDCQSSLAVNDELLDTTVVLVIDNLKKWEEYKPLFPELKNLTSLIITSPESSFIQTDALFAVIKNTHLSYLSITMPGVSLPDSATGLLYASVKTLIIQTDSVNNNSWNLSVWSSLNEITILTGQYQIPSFILLPKSAVSLELLGNFNSIPSAIWQNESLQSITITGRYFNHLPTDIVLGSNLSRIDIINTDLGEKAQNNNAEAKKSIIAFEKKYSKCSVVYKKREMPE